LFTAAAGNKLTPLLPVFCYLVLPATALSVFLTHILQLAAKYARRAEVLPQKAKFGVN
jgi:hypothetical protein